MAFVIARADFFVAALKFKTAGVALLCEFGRDICGDSSTMT
jgi:hypothetical protein